MIELRSKLRRWGNSFGIIVPQRAIENQELKEGDELTILIKHEDKGIRKVFGSLKKWEIDPQKFKDKIREQETKNEIFS